MSDGPLRIGEGHIAAAAMRSDRADPDLRHEGYTDHPMFVPFENEHLAAVLTLPESDPRGLVLLLQGLGAARSHKNQMWTRMSRALACRGIASVRMDYPDMGDSTGVLRTDIDHAPLEEVEVVARRAMETAGVGQFAAVGNCMGLRMGFAMASRLEGCTTVASILLEYDGPVLVRGQGVSASRRARRRAARRLRKLASIVGLRVPVAHAGQQRLLPEVDAVLRTLGGYFIYFGSQEKTGRFERTLARLIDAEKKEKIAFPRIGFRAIEATDTAGFRISVTHQRVLIDSIVEWMDGAFPGEA